MRAVSLSLELGSAYGRQLTVVESRICVADLRLFEDEAREPIFRHLFRLAFFVSFLRRIPRVSYNYFC